jgi:hypothetical protein
VGWRVEAGVCEREGVCVRVVCGYIEVCAYVGRTFKCMCVCVCVRVLLLQWYVRTTGRASVRRCTHSVCVCVYIYHI